MSTTGSWSPIPRCTAGGDSLVSSAYANLLIDSINALAQMVVNPTQQAGSFRMDASAAVLDLSTLVSRVSNLENATGIVYNSNGSTNVSITYQLTQLTNNVTTIETRLSNATATANCVGNVVITTITI